VSAARAAHWTQVSVTQQPQLRRPRKREDRNREPTQKRWGFGSTTAVAARVRVANDAATENFMARKGIEHTILRI
jgi:hypothetical protein